MSARVVSKYVSKMTRSTRREDGITLVLALWTLVGLLVDAYFHSTDPGLESFWTPWHALFYSGFTATAAWIGWMALSRQKGVGNWFDWAPVGYRPAMVGLVIFAAGGIGDAIWHSIYGVETSIDALLSPTHLLLFAGLLLILSAPFRSAWLQFEVTRPSLGWFLVPLLSLSLTTSVIAFVFFYAWAPSLSGLMSFPYDPNGDEFPAEHAVITIMLSTFIAFVPLMLASRRWRLPFGTASIFLPFIGLTISLGFDEDFIGIPALLAAGLAADGLISIGAPRSVVTAAPPLVLWSAFFAVVSTTDAGLGLTPEIWGGSIVLSSMVMLGIEVVQRCSEQTARLVDLSLHDISPIEPGIDTVGARAGREADQLTGHPIDS